MKVAIVTQSIKGNYGGVLQNFALQRVLRKLGHQPITIDYRDSSPLWFYLLQSVKTLMLFPFPSKRRAFTPYRNVFPRDSRIMNFVHQHIVLTKKQYLSYKKRILRDYQIEAVVVGSDQVWRPLYNPGCLFDMYLKFAGNAKVLKLAYAASFGVDIWEYTAEQTRICSRLIRDFKAVSVREVSAVSLCKKHLGRDVVPVLDPTLLLSREEYASVCSSVPVNGAKYVCCYMLDPTPEQKKMIEDFARDKHLQLIMFSAHEALTYSVEEWLAMFRDATCVVTDSFHGTVFSLIFQKEFYSLLNSSRGATRFESLLSQFALESRVVSRLDQIKEVIDWSVVESYKSKLVQSSLDFLRNGLS